MSGTPVLSSLLACHNTVELFNSVDSGNGPIVSVGIIEQLPAALDAAFEELVEVDADEVVVELALAVVAPEEGPPPQPAKPALIMLKMPIVSMALRLLISTSFVLFELLLCIKFLSVGLFDRCKKFDDQMHNKFQAIMQKIWKLAKTEK